MHAVAVGVHLCGPLSPRAIELFAATPALDALALVPCCLDKRADAALKAAARARGADPYELKVEELCAQLAPHAHEVSVRRDGAMRSNFGGEADLGSTTCKDAIIVGVRRR